MEKYSAVSKLNVVGDLAELSLLWTSLCFPISAPLCGYSELRVGNAAMDGKTDLSAYFYLWNIIKYPKNHMYTAKEFIV